MERQHLLTCLRGEPGLKGPSQTRTAHHRKKLHRRIIFLFRFVDCENQWLIYNSFKTPFLSCFYSYVLFPPSIQMRQNRLLMLVFFRTFLWRRTAHAFLPPLPKHTSFTLQHRHYSSSPLTGSTKPHTNEENLVTDERRSLLWKSLNELDIDAQELDQAAITSLENPTLGYDGRYGKSAIRTYRSFLFSTKQQPPTSSHAAAASQCARQIQFLLNRHKAHEAEFVRHHDHAPSSPPTTFPIVILLDNVRSAFNVGSIFRTADACGVSLVLTAPRREWTRETL